MTEQANAPNFEGSILTPREKVNLWLRGLELEADESPFDFAKYKKSCI